MADTKLVKIFIVFQEVLDVVLHQRVKKVGEVLRHHIDPILVSRKFLDETHQLPQNMEGQHKDYG